MTMHVDPDRGPTRGARQDLNPGEQRELMRELSVRGSRTLRSIAEEWNLGYMSLRHFAQGHRREIAAIAADLEDKFAGMWMADKEDRITAYMEEYHNSLNTSDPGHFEQAQVRLECIRAVAEELGQIPGRGAIVITPIRHIYVGMTTEEVQEMFS